MRKLRIHFLAASVAAASLLGCGDEIFNSGQDAAPGPQGDQGAPGANGMDGEQGPPGAPQTTNDNCQTQSGGMNADSHGSCFQPVGTIQGAVYDAWDFKPLANANITINYNGTAQTVTTAADGTYAFVDVPATSAPAASPFAVAGVYTIVLDLQNVMDADRSYRLWQERRVAVFFSHLGDGQSPAGSDQNTDTTVDGLVANLDFPVRQLRGGIAGTVYNAEDRTPLADFGLALTYAFGPGCGAPSSNTSAAGQVAASTVTGMDGSFMFSAIEEGVCYSVNIVNTRYVFAGGGNVYAAAGTVGPPVYALENGAIVRLADILVQEAVGRDVVPPYVVSSSPSDEEVLLAGEPLDRSITLTFSEPMDTTLQENVATRLLWGLEGMAGFPCLQVGANAGLAGAGNIVSGQWTPAPSTMSAPTAGQQCRTLDEIFTISTWDATGTTLTVQPQMNFTAGLAYAYRLDLINAYLQDLAGNPRTGALPASLPQVGGDSIARAGLAGNAPHSLVFTFQAGANVLTIATCDPATGTGLCQESDTADNQPSPGLETRASIIERLQGTERSFRDRVQNNLYQNDVGFTMAGLGGGLGMDNGTPSAANSSAEAYIHWDATPGAIAYITYFRSALYPNPQPLQIVGGTAPPRTAYNVSLATLNAILGMIIADNPNTPINEAFVAMDTGWDNGLNFELGIAALNVDGTEGPITFVAVDDNTTPEVRGTANMFGLGADWDYGTGAAPGMNVRPNGIVLNDGLFNGCVNSGTAAAPSRMHCNATAVQGYSTLTATGYGQRTVVIELNEPVRPTALTTENVAYQNGFVLNMVGNTTDVNGGEPDPTVAAVAPIAVADGKTRFFGVTLNNAFGIDSGDVLQIIGANGAISDLAGNAAAQATSSRTTADAPSYMFIDNTSPQIAAATYSAANNTVTVTLTKRAFTTDDNTGTNGNYNPANLRIAANDAGFNCGGTPAFFPTRGHVTNNAAGTDLQGVTHATSAGGVDTITYQVADVSWLAHNSAIQLANVQNLDFFGANIGSRATNATDCGTEAYVNIPFENAGLPGQFAPGAYVPGMNGIGTRNSQPDTVGPRLSLRDGDRVATFLDNGGAFNQIGNATNEFTVGCKALDADADVTGNFQARVRITDTTPANGAASGNCTTTADCATKWSVGLQGFGGCTMVGGVCNGIGWVAGTGNTPSTAQTTVAVTNVAGCNTADAGGGAICTINFSITNNADQANNEQGCGGGRDGRDYGILNVTLATTVTDTEGNAVNGNNVYTYSLNRNGGGANTAPGVARN